jgi:hypothetical protein
MPELSQISEKVEQKMSKGGGGSIAQRCHEASPPSAALITFNIWIGLFEEVNQPSAISYLTALPVLPPYQHEYRAGQNTHVTLLI